MISVSHNIRWPQAKRGLSCTRVLSPRFFPIRTSTTAAVANGRFKGQISLLHAFDIGDFVRLAESRQLLHEAQDLQSKETPRAPSNYGFDPPPLVVTKEGPKLPLADRPISTRNQALLYDFGAISSALTFEFEGTLPSLSPPARGH